MYLLKNKFFPGIILCSLIFSLFNFPVYCYGEPSIEDLQGFYKINKELVWGFLFCCMIAIFSTVFLCYKHTQLLKAQNSLKLSEQRFSKMFHDSPNIQAIVRLNDYVIVDVNKNVERFFGLPRERILGRSMLDLNIFVDEEQRNEFLTELSKEGKNYNKEITVCTREGTQRILQGSGVVVNMAGEQCMLLSHRDITESIEMEREIKKLERFNLIGQVAAGIGHEIRNPLTTVRGFLQLFQAKQESCQNFKDQFRLMIEELDRANAIITEFLTLARNKPERVETKNLNDVITKILPLMQAQATKEEKHVYAVLDKVPDLPLDENEIRQVIYNLVRNGLEAMHEGGNITIRTYTRQPHVILSIRDEGEGIKDEIMKKLGTPFYTTKDGGTGLGLAICYSIAERHRASIDVKTGPFGTDFIIKFPYDKIFSAEVS
ncbi:two-component system sensor histidine kinase NtrB [Desulfotomaculum sp. 1211_IL3151]|uniref:two-component system sensor histidine kinase NtrB n=1 Tax=Desulfotomaculum sp. 1211_IL3151 TaxID=3084055 RepID=UPI002FDABDA2